MNRKARRAAQKEHRQFVKSLPDALTPIPQEEIQRAPTPVLPIKAWRSSRYLVQMWEEANPDYPGLVRLSVCRTHLRADGSWQDGLTWDELQAIKAEVGFGNWYGVEIYPRATDVVNVANYRHLWLLPKPLSIGF